MAYSCVRVVFEIGHEASIRTKCTPEGFTHDWEVFVRGADNTDIKHFVEKVVFHLHETFPKPKRVVKEPPYSVKESGYAGFNLPIEIYFKTLEEPKKVRFKYDLNLQPSGPSISKVQREKYVFRNPDEDLRPRLIRGGGVGVGSDAGSHSTPGEKPSPVPTISSSTDEASSKASTPQLVGKPKLGGDPAKRHKIKEHRSEEPRVSNSFKDIFGTPIKTAKVSPDPKKPSPSPKVSPLPKPAKPPDKSSSDKSVNVAKPPKHNVQKDSRESSSSSSSSSSKEEKKDKNKDRDKSKEKTKHPTTPPKHPPSPPKVLPISKPTKDEPKKTQPEESKGKSDSKSPGESSKSEKKKKDKRSKDEKVKKEKHKEHESKSNDKLDKGEKSLKEPKDKDKDKDKDKEVSKKSEKDISKETEKSKEREKVSSDGDKGDKERSRHKHKKKERNKRDDSGKEKDRDREKGKKTSSDSKKSSDTKDKDRNGVSSESSKKRPRSPSHSPSRLSPSPKQSPLPEKPAPPPPPPAAKDKPAKRPLNKLFDELVQYSSDSNLSPLSGDEDLIEHPSQLTRSPIPPDNSNKSENSVKPDVQNETQVTSSSNQVNNKIEASKGKTESANQERYSLSKISSTNTGSNSTNISSSNKQKDRSVSKKNKEKKETSGGGGGGGGKDESGSKGEKDSSKKRKRKSSGKAKDDDASSGRVEVPASKFPKLDPEISKPSDQGGQIADSSSHMEASSTVEETKEAQAEDEFPAPVSAASAPTTANSSVQFSPDYVLQLKELQRKIMTLEDNAELQRVVQVIAETGQYEITKKTFDFDLCALDRSTVKRLQDFFTTS